MKSIKITTTTTTFCSTERGESVRLGEVRIGLSDDRADASLSLPSVPPSLQYIELSVAYYMSCYFLLLPNAECWCRWLWWCWTCRLLTLKHHSMFLTNNNFYCWCCGNVGVSWIIGRNCLLSNTCKLCFLKEENQHNQTTKQQIKN